MAVRLVHVRGYSDDLEHTQSTIQDQLSTACHQFGVDFESNSFEYDDFMQLLRGNESRTLIYYVGHGSVENGILLQDNVWVSGDVIRASTGNNVCLLLHCQDSNRKRRFAQYGRETVSLQWFRRELIFRNCDDVFD